MTTSQPSVTAAAATIPWLGTSAKFRARFSTSPTTFSHSASRWRFLAISA